MKNVLVLFPNDYDVFFLNNNRFPHCRFFWERHDDIMESLGEFSIWDFVPQLQKKYKDKNIDAIICTQDYPGILIATIVAIIWNLPTCTLESTIRLQHKYYSRELQKKYLPKETPQFCLAEENINFPCFVKPVKAVFSFLADRIENQGELHRFLEDNKERLSYFVKPFNDVLKRYPEFDIDADHFIAEEILEGTQVTLDGFCYDKKVHIMGIVDSVKYPGTNSFHSFEYPSKLPIEVQHRMIDMAKIFMFHSAYYGMFNLEMFYNKNKDQIDILEVNPRMFFAAADYFEKVKGINTYEIYLDIALGCELREYGDREGEFEVAATFTPRLFKNKLVKRIPSVEEVNSLKREFPDLILKIEHRVGQRLSDTIQSTGSYKYAVINLGGNSWENLYNRFEKVKSKLNFEFVDVE